MIYIQKKKQEITIQGHSGYEESGKDIVCASVSSIVTTTINALLRMDSNCLSYEAKDGYVYFLLKKEGEIELLLVENMMSLLKELEKDYKKYIKINEEV